MTVEEIFFRTYRRGKVGGSPQDTMLMTVPAKTMRIAVINQKGGCGKTTTAVNLSACLAELGCRVLLVDLDPQAHATLGLGVIGEDLPCSAYHLFQPNGFSAQQMMQSTYHLNLKLIPSNALLASSQVELLQYAHRERLLDERLATLEPHFNFILMDCPPTLNLLTINALTAATHFLVPVQTHYLSLDGMRELFKTIELVRENSNPQLRLLGILPTLFDRRTKMNCAMLEAVREHFKGQVFHTTIRLNMALTEAPMSGQPITRYAAQSHGADDYRQLAQELLERTHG